MIKKYKLLKKLPELLPGTIFERCETRHGGYIFQPRSQCYKFDGDEMESFSDWFEPVEERWKPRYGQLYYYINDNGEVMSTTNASCVTDIARWEFGNCFQTYKQTEIVCKVMRQALISQCPKS